MLLYKNGRPHEEIARPRSPATSAGMNATGAWDPGSRFGGLKERIEQGRRSGSASRSDAFPRLLPLLEQAVLRACLNA